MKLNELENFLKLFERISISDRIGKWIPMTVSIPLPFQFITHNHVIFIFYKMLGKIQRRELKFNYPRQDHTTWVCNFGKTRSLNTSSVYYTGINL